jgi:hypothetical protein
MSTTYVSLNLNRSIGLSADVGSTGTFVRAGSEGRPDGIALKRRERRQSSPWRGLLSCDSRAALSTR